MPQPASLAVPAQGRGRSRFSKALPAIPPIDTTVAEGSSTTPSLSSNVPSLASNNTVPPVTLGDLPPPPPPPHNDDPRVPIQYTPLPPIPMSKPMNKTTPMTPTTPTSGPPKMMIPRRPVGGSKQKPLPAKTHAPSQSQTPLAPPQSQVAQPQLPEQEPFAQLPLDVLDSFPVPGQQSPPQPVVASTPQNKELVQEQEQEQKQEKEQEQVGRQELEPQLASEKEQIQPPPQIQSEVHSQPSPAEVAATTSTNSASSNFGAPQEPPEPKPQTAEYLLPSELPQPMKSPSDSLSSILSAYSRSSTESIIRSSDGTYSTRDSHAQDSPSKYNSSSTIQTSSSYHETSASISTLTPSTAAQQTERPPPQAIANGNDSAPSPPAPPPPSKDNLAQRPTSPPARGPSGNNSELVTPSPPKQQIWRRRSLKGSRELPNLRLNYSHGSTASTASTATTQSQTTIVPDQNQGPSGSRVEASAPPPPPKGVSGLPGRNVRPAHSREQSSEKTTMGHGGSRLKQLKDKFHLSRRSDGSSSGNTELAQSESGNGEQTNRPNAYRPPTPEYQKQDVRTPILETFISPISPASPPEPPKQSIAAESQRQPTKPSETEELPPPPPAKSSDRAISRKRVPNAPSTGRDAIPSVDGSSEPKSGATPITSPISAAESKPTQLPSSAPAPPLHPTKSLPDLKTRFTPSPTTEPLPPASAFPSSGRNSPAPDGFPGRGRQFEPARRPASRESSARPESRRGFDPMRNSGPDSSRFVRSSTGDLLYRGRDGTLYPEMKEVQEPNPKAAQFPLPSGQLPAEGTIFEAAPLRDTHYNCYQKHRAMLRRNNKRYPLTCQTCLKADMEDRWACTFCSLRICESCLGLLESNKKDLTALMTALASSRTLSLSSPMRPGSALGLSMTAER